MAYERDDVLAEKFASKLDAEPHRESRVLGGKVLQLYLEMCDLLAKSTRNRAAREKQYDVCRHAILSYVNGGVPLLAALRQAGADDLVGKAPPKPLTGIG